jgi:hypothetical protein
VRVAMMMLNLDFYYTWNQSWNFSIYD